MKGRSASILVVLTLLGFLALPGIAWGITLSDLNLGSHIMGEKWDLASLKGRTVLVYFWDTG
jgi:hypothetical protein